ncbi:hypothetical protein TRFO_40328 [Tritrichomonas foetus]|uniref:Uncharacterized protein n=1 Tax=Tritrichomonas foetus TaxID=1144522 RepID=A0A1J4J1F0_9EUKA|nr:hypothetical protein TRFO_40328 [Tritrichomonas foetus]|eukprot:OHS93368.1 hypothetical protein TRFO_40328 [Tritrichomonas foetus]
MIFIFLFISRAFSYNLCVTRLSNDHRCQRSGQHQIQASQLQNKLFELSKNPERKVEIDVYGFTDSNYLDFDLENVNIPFIIVNGLELYQNIHIKSGNTRVFAFFANNVNIVFEQNEISFNFLRLKNSPISSNGKKLTLTAKSIFSDSISLQKDKIEQIIVEKDYYFINSQNIPIVKKNSKLTHLSNHELNDDEIFHLIEAEHQNYEKGAKLLADAEETTTVISKNSESETELIDDKNGSSSKAPEIDKSSSPNENESTPGAQCYKDRVYISENKICQCTNFSHCPDNQTELTFHGVKSSSRDGDTITQLTVYYNGSLTSPLLNRSFIINLEGAIDVAFDVSFTVFHQMGDPSIQNLTFTHDEPGEFASHDNESPVPKVIIDPPTDIIYKPALVKEVYYCLCEKTRFDRCRKDKDCSDFNVPEENYINGKEENFLNAIADFRTPDKVQFIVAHTGSNTLQLSFKPFTSKSKSLFFKPAAVGITTNLKIRDDTLSTTEAFSVQFSSITSVDVDEVFSEMKSLTLVKSKLHTEKNDHELKILCTDAYSIQNLQNKIKVTQFLAINSSEPLTYPSGKIVLKNGSSLYMPSIDGFPLIKIRENMIHFVDEDDDQEMAFTFEGNNSVFVSNILTPQNTLSFTKHPEYNSTNDAVNISFFFVMADSGMDIYFHDSMPKTFMFGFIPLSNESSPVNLNMTIANSSYTVPIAGISGNLNLIIKTQETLRHFLTHVKEGSVAKLLQMNHTYSVSDLASLTLDCQNYLRGITFNESLVTFSISEDTNLGLNSTVTKEFRIMTNTSEINFDIDTKLTTLSELELILYGPSTIIRFSKAFDKWLDIDDYSNLSKINIYHGDAPVTLIADNCTYVPSVDLIDNVTGVLFESTTKKVTFDNPNKAFGISQSRTGPSVEAQIGSKQQFIAQRSVLAKNVTFVGKQFFFLTQGKALSSYNFQTNVTVLNIDSFTENYTHENFLQSIAQNVSNVQFDATSIALCENCFFIQNTTLDSTRIETNITVATDSLHISNIATIKDSYFSPDGIIVYSDAEINDNTIDSITISSTGISFQSTKKGIKSTTIISANKNAKIQINTGTNLSIYCSDKTIIENVIVLVRNANQITMDKSWHNVKNAKSLNLRVSSARSRIKTPLLIMPDITITNANGNPLKEEQLAEMKIVHKAVYTNEIAFYIFIGLFGVVFLVTFFECAIGGCVLKDKKDSNEDEGENGKDGKGKAKRKGKAKGKGKGKHHHHHHHHKKGEKKGDKGEKKERDDAKAKDTKNSKKSKEDKKAAKENKKKAAKENKKKETKESKKQANKQEKVDAKAKPGK